MKISIVIPVFNEEETIAPLITALIERSKPEHLEEILICDGSSTDQTVARAQEAGAKVIHSPLRGRPAQLAYGGIQAQGELLYFLHADSLPPVGFDELLLQATKQGKEAGCFLIRFIPSTRFLRFFEFFVRIPWLICRGGDQSLFITRQLYLQIGGFNEKLKIMEDIEIIKRIRKHSSFHILSQVVETSSRKYERQGAWKLQFIFAWIHLQYWMGVSTETIYRRSKKTVQKS